jgi:type IX secretion system PorP/SprF family membrane protein
MQIKNNLCRIILSFLIILFVSELQAQDAHFSLYSKNPLLLNPANTGFYNGDHRGGISYKNQWRNISAPYKTYSAFYDALIFREKFKKDKFGAGIVFLSDKAGDTRMGLTKVMASFSYTKLLTNQNAFLFGFQGGFAQNSIDLSKSTWDNQFDGLDYNPNLSSNEPGYKANSSYFDFAGGVGWVFRPNNYIQSSTGFSLQHLGQPKVEYSSVATSNLYRKFVVHNTTDIFLENNYRFSFEPGFLYTKQGAHQEIIAGCMVRMKYNEQSKYTNLENETTFSIGGYYRFADAIILASRFNYENFELNLSYDLNTSKAKNITKLKGGFEISLIYIHPYKTILNTKGVPKFF